MNTMTINNSNVKIVDINVSQLAKEFKGYFIKTAENILEMARITSQATRELKGQKYKEFCHLIGFESQSSTLRKLNTIGEKYELLKNNVDSLPASWTTLYQISLISPDDIVKYVDVGVINPDLTLRELKSVTDPNSKPSKQSKTVPNRTVKKGGLEFKVVLSQQPSEKITQKIRKILSECQSLEKVEVEVGASLEEFLKPTVATA